MPLELPFFQRAMLASGLAALVCAVVGTFVVLKGLAFMGDAVAHSSLAGMSVAFLFGGNVFLGFTSPSRRTDDENCHAFAIAAKCSSHLGFGLVVQQH